MATECRDARKKFDTWFDANQTADDAFNHAQNQWSDAHISDLMNRGAQQQVNAAIDAYNTDLQAAQASQASADQTLAAFNEVRSRCTESNMPQACQNEFAQYTAIIDNAARSSAADTAIAEGISTQQDAARRGAPSAFNDSVDAANAAVSQHNDIANEWNVTLKPAYNAAISACNDAT